ncbi:4'-phosphopantetheinyl transferase family protein [Allofrancisella frigidaquae]|uniref:4'-phosphopantetheinyl transferase superfamily protein n=1 Tax=Allofrancisella frigidaquae TaxID=1085644 RepID=A0A6M3HS14_9GAMM|nr:4'-phosphopantetheinyl transferase superfamily protein [Allofrancisella frigidaquae]KEI34881.1 phosphopantetheinyl transferase [Francisella sp. W12-1067]QIV93923.1 4'-phosphopantetheinyl transferase superfamily protein [Allofrancisella frigidaquae]
MQNIYVFILTIKDFIATDVAELLKNRFSIEVSSNQKLFSNFLRYWVFGEFFDISNPVFYVDNNNKPFLENSESLKFSISHTLETVVIAVASNDIGIDVENIKRKRKFLNVAERYFSQGELQILRKSSNLDKDFYTLWTLKEAQVKRNGLGIAYGFAEAKFSRNNKNWCSNNYPNDFFSFEKNENIFSVCSKDVVNKDISIFKIMKDFSFQEFTVARF